jgi:hypothetical protein
MTEKDWDFIREQMPKMEPVTNKTYDFNRVLMSATKKHTQTP